MKKSYFIYKDENIEFEYKEYLPVSERIDIVAAVSNAVVGTNYYLPLLKNLAVKYHMVKAYAPNVDLSMLFKNNDEGQFLDWNEVEIFFLETKVYDIISTNVDQEQFNEIIESIDDNIAYATGIEKTTIGNELIKKYKSEREQAESMSKIMTEENMNSMLAFMKQVASIENFDTETLVDAIVDKKEK